MEIARVHDGTRYACRRHKNGTFYVHWTEGRRSRRQSTGQKSVAAAQAFLDQWLTLEAGAPASSLTIDDLFTAKYPDPSDRTVAAWRQIGPVYGALTVQDATPAREARYTAARRKAGAAPATVRFEVAMLRAVLNNAVRQRLVAADDVPAQGPLPPDSPPRDRWLTGDETDALFAAASGNRRLTLFLHLALETAARRGAIQELRWDQVDWEAGIVHYLPAGTVQTRKRKASVPISQRLRPVLEAAWAERGADPYVIGRGGNVNGALAAAAARAGVAGVTPHVLRHTAATRMARRGVPLWIIAKVLGNSMLQVEKAYAKWQPDMARDAVEMISAA